MSEEGRPVDFERASRAFLAQILRRRFLPSFGIESQIQDSDERLKRSVAGMMNTHAEMFTTANANMTT